MRKVGVIREIWRYPVKGMGGEALDRADLGERGLPGDRIWALRDTKRAEIQSCKFRPELLTCDARVRDDRNEGPVPHVDVRFPDGSTIGSDSAEVHARLSALTRHASTLEPLRPAEDTRFYRRHRLDDHTWLDELKATFDREPGEPLPDFSGIPPSMVEFVSTPGTFFLVAPLHVVTTATLRRLQALNPQGDWNPRRFRPNIVVDTDPALDGYAEQAWIGRPLAIGAAAVDCVGATPRCGAITRAQSEFGADTSVLRTVVRHADQNVGVYGLVTTAGEIRPGDPVYLG